MRLQELVGNTFEHDKAERTTLADGSSAVDQEAPPTGSQALRTGERFCDGLSVRACPDSCPRSPLNETEKTEQKLERVKE